MFNERNGIRGRIVHIGAARIMRGAGDRRIVKRSIVLEFEDTASMEESVNSGFVEFDLLDDDETVAIVLEGTKRG